MGNCLTQLELSELKNLHLRLAITKEQVHNLELEIRLRLTQLAHTYHVEGDFSVDMSTGAFSVDGAVGQPVQQPQTSH